MGLDSTQECWPERRQAALEGGRWPAARGQGSPGRLGIRQEGWPLAQLLLRQGIC